MRPKSSNQTIDSGVAREVTRIVNASDKTQHEIAHELGLERSNIITMFKQGRTKLPLNKVVPLSRACGVDPAKLMLLCLEEYQPGILEALGEALRATVTEDEAALLRSIRHAKQTGCRDTRKLSGKRSTKRNIKCSAPNLRRRYITSPEALKLLYEFSLKHLIC